MLTRKLEKSNVTISKNSRKVPYEKCKKYQ